MSLLQGASSDVLSLAPSNLPPLVDGGRVEGQRSACVHHRYSALSQTSRYPPSAEPDKPSHSSLNWPVTPTALILGFWEAGTSLGTGPIKTGPIPVSTWTREQQLSDHVGPEAESAPAAQPLAKVKNRDIKRYSSTHFRLMSVNTFR